MDRAIFFFVFPTGFQMNELVEKVASKVGISSEQASQAVSTVIEFVKSKLPDSIAGQLDGFIGDDAGDEGSSDLLDKAKGALGGILGGDDD